ncbi:hypothetical protein GO755_19275 [Spirosoma sp. HMF4905]|uniref:SH3 domain-containing protein n=1 Tax=Spirosoma arboris TaxID=2682092 RepID=A0A7K1SEQ0_9BACT|nr:hypothetical protein [Spirosoma arboris]MVM32198.1 hypothetical protein [Spirosoma arboris]
MKIGVLLLLFLTQHGLAQSDTILNRYQFRYPLNKSVLADAPLKAKPLISSTTLLTIPANSVVSIIEKDSEFYKVIYNNRDGYIPYIYLEKDFETFKSRNYPHKSINETSNGLVNAVPPPDTANWYGKIGVICPIRKEPNSQSENLFNLPIGTIVKLRRYDYSYWRIELGRQIGYAGVYYIGEVSKSANPFVPTRYTGPTYDRYEAVTRDSTFRNRSSIRTEVNKGRPSINLQKNKPSVRPK